MYDGNLQEQARKEKEALEIQINKQIVYFNKSDPSISGQSGRQLDCRVQ